jgi:hypothetical protein
MLDAALNKGNKPPIIEDRIEVVELEMGTQVMHITPDPHTSKFETFDASAPRVGGSRYRRLDYGPV